MSDTVTCIECGKTEELRWVEDRNAELRRRGMCYEDTYWAEYLERPNRHRYAVVTADYHHYWIGDEDDGLNVRGFGGALFKVAFKDGRVVETTNLWAQGPIPERWHDRYTHNADVQHITKEKA